MKASQDDAVTDDAKDDEQGVEDRLQAKNKYIASDYRDVRLR